MISPESRTPTANYQHTGSAGTMHREVHSPIEMACSDKRTTKRIDKLDSNNGDKCTQTSHDQQTLRWIEKPTWSRVDKHCGGKSFSHHHRHSAWQRTELRRVYGDTGITEMNGATGSIYSGDPGVDSILSHLIIQRITHSIFPIFRSHSLCPRFRRSTQLRGSSRPGSIISSHPLPTLHEPEPLFLTNSLWNSARGAAECWWWALCLLAPPFHHSIPDEEVASTPEESQRAHPAIGDDKCTHHTMDVKCTYIYSFRTRYRMTPTRLLKQFRMRYRTTAIWLPNWSRTRLNMTTERTE